MVYFIKNLEITYEQTVHDNGFVENTIYSGRHGV